MAYLESKRKYDAVMKVQITDNTKTNRSPIEISPKHEDKEE